MKYTIRITVVSEDSTLEISETHETDKKEDISRFLRTVGDRVKRGRLGVVIQARPSEEAA